MAETEVPYEPRHDFADCFNFDAYWCRTQLAPQQELGLRTQWWPWIGGHHHPGAFTERTCVS